MQIVSSNQVEYCQVTHRSLVANKKLLGLVYQGKLLVQISSYPLTKSQNAIIYGREEFLANKGRVLVLVVEEKDGFTVWREDVNLARVIQQSDKKKHFSTVQVVSKMRGLNGLDIRDRMYKLKNYPRCFIGSDAVSWLTSNLNISVKQAIELGQKLIEHNWIHHVADDHNFKNEYLFYRFYCDEEEIPKTFQLAFQNFAHGLATGEWELFLAMSTDDFNFSFPMGKFKGEHIGKEKAAEFFYYLSNRVFSQGLFLAVKRITYNSQTAVFEVISEGKMFETLYRNQGAISFDIRGDKISGYREYLSLVFPMLN